MGLHNIVSEQVFGKDKLRVDAVDFHGKNEFPSCDSCEWVYKGFEWELLEIWLFQQCQKNIRTNAGVFGVVIWKGT